MRLLEELRQYPGVRELRAAGKSAGPVMQIALRRGDLRSTYFSLLTTVGTPQSIPAQELRIECMFPVDEGEAG